MKRKRGPARKEGLGGGGGQVVLLITSRIGQAKVANNAVTFTVAESDAMIAIVNGQKEGPDFFFLILASPGYILIFPSLPCYKHHLPKHHSSFI
jgi:hypothetical protein